MVGVKMNAFTSIKAAFKWLIIITLLLSIFINYRLFDYSNELKQDNQQLSHTLKAQQQNNDHLATQIESLNQDKKHAQQVQDDMVNKQQRAHIALENRLKQLKKELEHAPCNNQLIDYPAQWVSGYEYDN